MDGSARSSQHGKRVRYGILVVNLVKQAYL